MNSNKSMLKAKGRITLMNVRMWVEMMHKPASSSRSTYAKSPQLWTYGSRILSFFVITFLSAVVVDRHLPRGNQSNISRRCLFDLELFSIRSNHATTNASILSKLILKQKSAMASFEITTNIIKTWFANLQMLQFFFFFFLSHFICALIFCKNTKTPLPSNT